MKEAEENQKRLRRLLNLSQKEQILDPEFQAYVIHAKGYFVLFKEKYNLPITDPRLTEATLSDVMEDALIGTAVDYVLIFESHDPASNEFAKRHTLDSSKTSEEERKKISEMLKGWLKA